MLRAVANNGCPNPEQKYTSARLVSRQTLARDQGVLTAVILSPCAEGIWPAFWLLPQEPFAWPTDGEVDIAETWNGDRANHSCRLESALSIIQEYCNVCSLTTRDSGPARSSKCCKLSAEGN